MKMLSIRSHKENTTKNNIEIPLHPNQNGYHQENKQQMLVRMQGGSSPYTLLVGM
jgi:hypothetical protein